MANGFIQTPEQAKQTILSDYRNAAGSRTFGSLYTANELAGARAEQQVEQQYGEQIGQAYKAAMAQRSSILSSNLGEGYKTELSEDVQKSITQAYDKYMSDLSEAKQSIAQNVNKGTSSIDTALGTEAENLAAYNNALGDYYVARDEEMRNTLSEEDYIKYTRDPLWAKYYTYDFSENPAMQNIYEDALKSGFSEDDLAKVFSEYRRLKTLDELSQVAYEDVTDPDGTVRREYSSLFDEEGNLTLAGVDFYDQLENFAAQREGQGTSFGEYLQTKNPELFEWAKSYNPYDVTDDQTRAGSFRTMTGRTSTDYEYSFIERFGGLTKSQTDKAFDKIYKHLDKGVDISNVESAIDQFKEISEHIGLTQQDINWTYVKEQVSKALSTSKEYKKLSKEYKASGGTGIAFAILGYIGSLIMTATGAGAPAGLGTAGLSTALMAGGISELQTAEEYENASSAYEAAAKRAYLDTIDSMINLLQSKQRQAQITAYKASKASDV